MITREELKDECCALRDCNPVGDYFINQIYELIKNGAGAKSGAAVGSTGDEVMEVGGLKNGGWISVKDRLPEESKYHLCYLVGDKNVYNKKIKRRVGYDATGKHWYLNLIQPCIRADCYSVTHWMPLPDDPVGNF